MKFHQYFLTYILMQNNGISEDTTTVGWKTYPTLALVNKWKLEALLTGICLKCHDPLRVCHCEKSM